MCLKPPKTSKSDILSLKYTNAHFLFFLSLFSPTKSIISPLTWEETKRLIILRLLDEKKGGFEETDVYFSACSFIGDL